MKTVLFFLCLLNLTPAFCQDENPVVQQKEHKNLIGVSIGINDFHMLDEYLSPHTLSKAMFCSQMSWQFKTKKTTQSFDLQHSFGHPGSGNQSNNVIEKMGSISYSIIHVLKTVNIGGKAVDFSSGAGISSFIANTNFITIDKKNSYQWEEQSWYCSNSINLILNSEYHLASKGSFFVQVTMPMFSMTARPANGHTFNEDNNEVINSFLKVEGQGKPEFFWNNLVVLCQAGYSQHLNNHCIFRLNYVFDYVSSDRPLPLKMYMNQFSTGIDFLF
jgi:hypothetical protein